MHRRMKTENITLSSTSNTPNPSACVSLYRLAMHCLAILAMYTPLLWYTLHLHTLYPQHTNVLEMNLLHLSVVVVLLIVPLLVLSSLGVRWQDKENTLPLA